MLIVYASLTGNVRRFVSGLDRPVRPWTPELDPTEPFVFVTYTTGFGAVPDGVTQWLDRHQELLRGVAASGNRNWGANFAKAGKILAARYHVSLLHAFELSGLPADAALFTERVDALSTTSSSTTS